MKRAVAIAMMVMGAVACARSTDAPAAPSDGKMQFASTAIDLGEIAAGDVVGQTLHYKAIGGNVAIERIEKNCDCLAVDATDATKDTEGKVKITLDTRGLMGNEVQVVRLFSAADTAELIISVHINNNL